jgi:glycosyltransferase involved in cell wall biosynthesis
VTYILDDSMKKTVLVFATTYPTFLPWDATPPFVHELTKRLVSDELEMIVLCPRRPWTKSFEEQEWVKIYRYWYFFRDSWEKLADGAIVPNIKSNYILLLQIPFLLLWGFFWLIKLWKKYTFNYIHAHWIFPNWTLAVIYKKLFNKKIKVICTSHGSDLHTLKWVWIDSIKKWTIDNCYKVTVVSEYLKDILDNLMKRKTDAFVIPMWVDCDLFNPSKREDSLREKYHIEWLFLLNVWRLAPEKWQKDLILAMPEVLRKYPKGKLIVIWDWPLMYELKDLSYKLWVDKSVVFLWKISNKDLPKRYATCDIFIMSSYKEWSPVVLIEAILCWSKIIINWIKQCIDILSSVIFESSDNTYINWDLSTFVSSWWLKLVLKNKLNISLVKSKFSWRNISYLYNELFLDDN